jgi:hypothetical protein
MGLASSLGIEHHPDGYGMDASRDDLSDNDRGEERLRALCTGQSSPAPRRNGRFHFQVKLPIRLCFCYFHHSDHQIITWGGKIFAREPRLA